MTTDDSGNEQNEMQRETEEEVVIEAREAGHEAETEEREEEVEEGAGVEGEAGEEEDFDEEDEEEEGDEQSALKPEEELQELIDAAKAARLTVAEEERAVELLGRGVRSGPKALPATLEALLTLPWSVVVKGVTEAWAETKPAGRTRVIAALAKADSEGSRRLRLSLARGLQGQDAGSALKLLMSVCEAMGGAQGGSTTKDRQIFSNVMLGKARPWLLNVPMAEMKPADAHKLMTPALEACGQAPIFTQIWVLRWIIDAGKFDVLPPEHVESIAKSINRWQPRWRKELRKIITKVPESLEALLVDGPHGRGGGGGGGMHGAAPAAAEVEEAAGAEPEAEAEADTAEGDEEEEEEAAPVERRVREQREPARGRETRETRVAGGGRQGSGMFDLGRSLREIEVYVARLKSELQQAQLAARRREPSSSSSRSRAPMPASVEELDELRRHNQQLEAQNQELRQRIEDLMSDHEDRAATMEIDGALEQFKTLLGLKLKEDYAVYEALSRESLSEVVRRHGHEVLGQVFDVLKAEGVKFDQGQG